MQKKKKKRTDGNSFRSDYICALVFLYLLKDFGDISGVPKNGVWGKYMYRLSISQSLALPGLTDILMCFIKVNEISQRVKEFAAKLDNLRSWDPHGRK